MSKKPPERVAPAKKQAVDLPRQSMFLADPNELVVIGCDTDDGDEHPLWDPSANDDDALDELAESLGTVGQLQTIIVRKNGAKLEVVAGRHRTKAARIWNEANPGNPIKLRVTIAKGAGDGHPSDLDLMRIAVVENEHRRSRSPIYKARLARRFQRYMGDDEIAKMFRVGEHKIHEWLALLDLAPELQAAVDSGAVPVRQAQAVATLTLEEQAEAVHVAAASGQSLSHATMPPIHRPSRQRGSSHNPSSRPGLVEIRAELEDDTIADADVIGATPLEIRNHVLRWITGDAPHLNRRADADKDAS